MIPALACSLFITLAPEVNTSSAIPKVQGESLKAVTGVKGPQYYADLAMAFPGPTDRARAVVRKQTRRNSLIATRQVETLPVEIEDKLTAVAGWKAYRIELQPQKGFKARLHALHEAWFTVRLANRQGLLGPGMTQSLQHQLDPGISYVNSTAKAQEVFLVVDSTDMAAEREPYRLLITQEESKGLR